LNIALAVKDADDTERVFIVDVVDSHCAKALDRPGPESFEHWILESPRCAHPGHTAQYPDRRFDSVKEAASRCGRILLVEVVSELPQDVFSRSSSD
jgi:hypothetical protein